jgi:hypothetical protein
MAELGVCAMPATKGNVIELELPMRIYDQYAFQSPPDDDAVLLARLRLTASNIDLDLRMREALIPPASSMVFYRRVKAIFLSDLELCEAWLNDGRPSLEELRLIISIVNKWDANHARTNPYWRYEATPEQAAINHKIVEVIDRLIARGLFTEEPTQ